MRENIITRREFGRMIGAGLAYAATVSGNGWAGPLPEPLALIGCGRRGGLCLDALAASEVAVACDVDRSRGTALAARAQAAFTDKWRQCVEDDAITGVVVAVSDTCAPEICRAAAENGKRVFLDCSDSNTLAALVAKLGEDAMPACNVNAVFPWSPAATAIANLIHEGRIGSVRFGHASWGGCAAQPGVDVVFETHATQLFFLLTVLRAGAPVKINTIGSQKDYGHHSLLTTLNFETGIQLNITSSVESLSENTFIIRGADGNIEYKDGRLALFPDSGGARHIALPKMGQVRYAALRKWNNCSETERMACSVKTINAALKQIQT